MKKKLIAFCMAIFVFAGSSVTALAGNCPAQGAQGRDHCFSDHRYVGMGRTDDLGTHSYLYGYDENGKPIYRICKMTQTVKYCTLVCYWCGQDDPSGAHQHAEAIKHSLSHP